MLLRNYLKVCPACGKKFVPTDKTPVLEAVLSSSIQYPNFCSETCMENRLNNLNSNNGAFDLPVEIVSKEHISFVPNRWKVVLREKDLKVEYSEI